MSSSARISSKKTLIFYMILWYCFSASTLFLNKWIISYYHGDAMLLGTIQLQCCSLTSYLYLKYRHRFMGKSKDDENKHRAALNFHHLIVNPMRFALIGGFRYATAVLGLIALWYIPVSFAEMIKSSAPIFTVVISLLVLKEQTSCLTIISLVPIMVGLALCSAFEIQFDIWGFIIALLGVVSECMQNVLSKRVLIQDKYDSNQIQLFTSIFSIFLQLPYMYYVCFTRFDLNQLLLNRQLFINYFLCGLSFHLQTLTEYALLNIISPVSHSVANTVKRALLIWLSVLIFGNPVPLMSWLGTALVIIGVIFYNRTKNPILVALKDDSIPLTEAEKKVDSV